MTTTGPAVSINTTQPLVAVISGPSFDEDGYQRAQRINGSFACPGCGLVWPLFEDIEEWTEGDDGRWHASAWGPGYGFCDVCRLAVCSGFDEDYVIDCGEGMDEG